jgi:hypothetical protein
LKNTLKAEMLTKSVLAEQPRLRNQPITGIKDVQPKHFFNVKATDLQIQPPVRLNCCWQVISLAMMRSYIYNESDREEKTQRRKDA